MKNISLLSSLLLSCLLSPAQTLTMDKVPPAAAHTFHMKYPAAQQDSWELIGSNLFQVGFFNGKKAQTAHFDNTGKWLETETDITNAQIPRPVSNAIAREFPGFSIQVISLIESPDGMLTYEAVVFKLRENYDVTFSAKGEVLKKEAGQVNE
jgi:hypothetical protein